MSYILNALRKSEKQRQTDQIPTLEQSVLENKTEKNSWKSSLVFLLIFVNLITLALFIWLYQESSNSLTTTVKNTKKTIALAPHSTTDITYINKTSAAETHHNTPQFPAAPSNGKTISDIVQQQKNRQGTTNRSTPDDNKNSVLINQFQSISPAKTASGAQFLEPSANKSTKQKTAAKNSLSTTTKPNQSKPKTAISRIDESHPPGIDNRPHKLPASPSLSKQPAKNQPPWLKELPSEFRHRVPILNINVFAYSDNPGERFVLIDMVKYTVGQKISADMQLKKILNDSMVVDFEGKTFRIQRP